MNISHIIFLICAFLSVRSFPHFRILAPLFICPKDETLLVEKPNNSVITIKAVDALLITFDVGWSPLPAPTQRFTLMLWQSIRNLQKKLNEVQPEPYVYIIDHDDLLNGVIYVFNVTGKSFKDGTGLTKAFTIDNSVGSHKLENLEGQSNLFSVYLLGAEVVYADMEYIVEAVVTTCTPTQDYVFMWTVYSLTTKHDVNVSTTMGSRLDIPPYILKPGRDYRVQCLVVRESDREYITQVELTVSVRHRGLSIHINVDRLIITKSYPFILEAYIEDSDNFNDSIEYQWTCYDTDKKCDFIEEQHQLYYNFSKGIPHIGEYHIVLRVQVESTVATANSTVVVVEPKLPVLQIVLTSHLVNEGDQIYLTGNASDVAPSCNLTWYFATETYLADLILMNDTMTEHQHGEPITDTMTVFSMEENFLSEIADFTNETEWKQIIATVTASSGRARLVAKCGCSVPFDCQTEGESYAEIYFHMNQSPIPSEIKVTPDTGTALLTLFRVSTLAASDPDTPLKYSFYCSIGSNESLLLACYIEELAVETHLPYNENGTEVWVEVCDSLGACSKSETLIVHMKRSDGSTTKQLIETIRGHIKRCEFASLFRVAVSTVISYINSDQWELSSLFMTSLLEMLPSLKTRCGLSHYQYTDFLKRLSDAGIQTANLVDTF